MLFDFGYFIRPLILKLFMWWADVSAILFFHPPTAQSS